MQVLYCYYLIYICSYLVQCKYQVTKPTSTHLRTVLTGSWYKQIKICLNILKMFLYTLYLQLLADDNNNNNNTYTAILLQCSIRNGEKSQVLSINRITIQNRQKKQYRYFSFKYPISSRSVVSGRVFLSSIVSVKSSSFI